MKSLFSSDRKEIIKEIENKEKEEVKQLGVDLE